MIPEASRKRTGCCFKRTAAAAPEPTEFKVCAVVLSRRFFKTVKNKNPFFIMLHKVRSILYVLNQYFFAFVQQAFWKLELRKIICRVFFIIVFFIVFQSWHAFNYR